MPRTGKGEEVTEGVEGVEEVTGGGGGIGERVSVEMIGIGGREGGGEGAQGGSGDESRRAGKGDCWGIRTRGKVLEFSPVGSEARPLSPKGPISIFFIFFYINNQHQNINNNNFSKKKSFKNQQPRKFDDNPWPNHNVASRRIGISP